MVKVLFSSNINRVIEKRPKPSDNLGLVITITPKTTLWKIIFLSSLKEKSGYTASLRKFFIFLTGVLLKGMYCRAEFDKLICRTKSYLLDVIL